MLGRKYQPETGVQNVSAKISYIHPKTLASWLGISDGEGKGKSRVGLLGSPQWLMDSMGIFFGDFRDQKWAESHLKMTNMCGCSGLNWVCNYRVLEVFEVLLWWFFPFPPIPPGPFPREWTKCTCIDNAKNDKHTSNTTVPDGCIIWTNKNNQSPASPQKGIEVEALESFQNGLKVEVLNFLVVVLINHWDLGVETKYCIYRFASADDSLNVSTTVSEVYHELSVWFCFHRTSWGSSIIFHALFRVSMFVRKSQVLFGWVPMSNLNQRRALIRPRLKVDQKARWGQGHGMGGWSKVKKSTPPKRYRHIDIYIIYVFVNGDHFVSIWGEIQLTFVVLGYQLRLGFVGVLNVLGY